MTWSHPLDTWLDQHPIVQALESFLNGGEPPIYMGFGSMPLKDPIVRQVSPSPTRQGRFMRGVGVQGLAVDFCKVLRKLKRRGVLQLPSYERDRMAEMLAQHPHVCLLPEVPLQWLFPRCSVVRVPSVFLPTCTLAHGACHTQVVHHGGAGTTAAAVKAGVPSVIFPLLADQPFWASRVRAPSLQGHCRPLVWQTNDQLVRACRLPPWARAPSR